MRNVSPLGKVYQAGTLSGNPMAVTAGLAQLRTLYQLNPWQALEEKGMKLEAGLKRAAASVGCAVQINRVGAMFTIFFSDFPVNDTESAMASNTKRFAKFFHAMLDQGILFPPSQFETKFFGTQHSEEILTKTVAAAQIAFEKARA